MLVRVISGGQSGTDFAALVAARAAGLATGGWAPKGWKTEAGPNPMLAEYGLKEHPSSSYAARTKQNVVEADATLAFDAVTSPGTEMTINYCCRLKKPLRVMMMDRIDRGRVRFAVAAHTVSDIVEWLIENDVRTLNVAGNRESKAPGIGVRVTAFLTEVFQRLKETANATSCSNQLAGRRCESWLHGHSRSNRLGYCLGVSQRSL